MPAEASFAEKLAVLLGEEEAKAVLNSNDIASVPNKSIRETLQAQGLFPNSRDTLLVRVRTAVLTQRNLLSTEPNYTTHAAVEDDLLLSVQALFDSKDA